MTAHDLLTQSTTGLLSHRLRTTLSSLGIVVGVATVVASLAVSEGARRAALADIGVLGIDNLFVRSASAADRNGRSLAPVLSRRDAEALLTLVRGVESIAVSRLTRAEVRHQGRAATAAVAGISATWTDLVSLTCEQGRCLSIDDERSSRRVAVVGAALSRRILPSGDPLGSLISIGGQPFRVVGVLPPAERGSGSSLQPFSPDDAALVPWTVMDLPLGQGDDVQRVSEIGVRLRKGVSAVDVAAEITALLARNVPGGKGFELVVPRELLRARLQAQRTFDAVLLATGLIALIISGIGIMNIMLASVTEREQEIGVRRAIGARRWHIVAQFAVEAALLCLAGGLTGVPLGAGLSWIVALLAGWPVALTPVSIALALLLAAVAGLVFGIYPAQRAASIDPIEALRG